MTKKMVIGMALAITVLGGTAVYAGVGCNNGWVGMFGDNPDIEKVRVFQKETLVDRDEMMIKRLELNQELSKNSPDLSKVEILRKEMIDLRTKLQSSAGRLGLTGGCLADCNLDPVDCVKGGCWKQKGMQGKQAGGCGNCYRKQ